MNRFVISVAITLLLSIGACGSTESTADDDSAVSAASEPEAVPTHDAGPEPTATPTVEETADEPEEPAAPETFTMPNLVGQNLQDAQDELQSLGSYLLRQNDATGQGRFQVLDANWKVCSQKQTPGATVDIAQLVTLEAVKLSESCP